MVREKQSQGDEDSARQHEEESPAEAVPLMRLAPGERFFKFYILSDQGKAPGQRVEHRIITKEHVDGSLEMVSYNAWVANGQSAKRDVIRVPSLSKALLDRIVQRLRTQGDVAPDSFREIDLSQCETVQDQLRLLAQLGI